MKAQAGLRLENNRLDPTLVLPDLNTCSYALQY
jgi:hypothetical protein